MQIDFENEEALQQAYEKLTNDGYLILQLIDLP